MIRMENILSDILLSSQFVPRIQSISNHIPSSGSWWLSPSSSAWNTAKANDNDLLNALVTHGRLP